MTSTGKSSFSEISSKLLISLILAAFTAPEMALVADALTAAVHVVSGNVHFADD